MKSNAELRHIAREWKSRFHDGRADPWCRALAGYHDSICSIRRRDEEQMVMLNDLLIETVAATLHCVVNECTDEEIRELRR